MLRAVVIGLAALTGLGACSSPGPNTDEAIRLGEIQLAGSLQRFDACDELTAEVHDQASEAVGPHGLAHGLNPQFGEALAFGRTDAATAARGPIPMPVGERAAASLGDQGGAAGTASEELAFSGTNVQEAGIDEPDIVKTDGRVIVVASGNRLFVLRPGSPPEIAGSVELPSAGATEILLLGERVLVFGAGHDGRSYWTPGVPPAPATMVTVVSLAEPASPRVMGTATTEGAYVTARLVDGTARLVLRTGAPPVPWVQPLGGARPGEWERHVEAAAQRNRQLLEQTTAQDWIPDVVDSDGNRRELVDCEQVYHPEEPAGVGMVTVVSIDETGEFGEAVSVMASAETVYASDSALYVVTTEWAPRPDGSGGQSTSIHRFDITDPTRAYYTGSGSVPGHLLNQFSMSEHDGVLRVATTRQGPGGSDSVVTTLRPDAGALVQVGQVGGLGRTERIYAVRFLGDLGYVVTFRQVDPLYVIDLRDPAAPRVAGELKIPGYSAYLHPVGDGLLLGVGQDATDTGMRTGMQVSLFDVSDPARPVRIDHETLPNEMSAVELDHRAFLWWEPEALAVVPTARGDAVAYEVTKEGIGERGRISSLGAALRSLVVGDALYTVSESGVSAHDLDTLAARGRVSLSL